MMEGLVNKIFKFSLLAQTWNWGTVAARMESTRKGAFAGNFTNPGPSGYRGQEMSTSQCVFRSVVSNYFWRRFDFGAVTANGN